MLAVRFNPYGSSSFIELENLRRPAIKLPTEAILMVTTAAIGPWEVERARNGTAGPTPGAQFAGIVVEVGQAVTAVDIDDLVVPTCAVDGVLFGTASLPGGHAEYVSVPSADRSLIMTTPAAEERSLFAGGAAALGFAAADSAIDQADGAPLLVIGCDAAGLSALARIRHRRKRQGITYAFDTQPARVSAAKSYGAQEVSEADLTRIDASAIIIGAKMNVILELLPSNKPVFATDPTMTGITMSALWPSKEQAQRAEMAIRLRQIDLTPLVSTVVPLGEAADGYRVALESPQGTRSVLLKP